ncbi:MAG: response regulator [Oscillospiraceae bacterium]|nr:response regulator [Oscillospiraceae bacterium]
MNTINNERAMKTSRARICSALLQLLQTKPYRRITVSQVCDSAGVSRPTFYKSFDSMDAVVRYRLLQLKKIYDRDHAGSGSIRALLTDFYAFVRSNREINLLLNRGKLYPILEDIVREDYQSRLADRKGQAAACPACEYLPGYMSATVVSLLRKWIESGYLQTPEQMGDLASNLIGGCDTQLPAEPAGKAESGRSESISDILNNIPTGVCVLFMPDETHQEIRFANTQQMRLINPNLPSPEKADPQQSAFRAGYYKNAFSGVHPDDLPAALKAFREGFHEKRFRIPPIRLKTGSGDYIWVAMDVTLREDLPDGKLFYASYRDVSKEMRLQQELELQRQKNMEQTLLDTIGRLPACSALYREGPDGALIPERYSEELLLFLGYSQENAAELHGKSMLQAVHPGDRDRILQAMEAARGDGAPHSAVVRLLIRNDGFKWVSAALTRFSFSEEKYLYILFTDIDDLKKQEAQLQRQYDAAQSFLDSVADTYLMTQRSNLTQNKVEALRGRGAPPASWVGRGYDELAGRLMQEVKGAEDRKSCADLLDRACLLSLFEKGVRTVTREFRSCPAGQETLWLQGVTTLSKHPKSGDIFAFFALSDIREKKLSEAIIHNIIAEQCDYVCCIDAKSGRFMLFIPNKRWSGKEIIPAGSDYAQTLCSIFVKYVVPEEREKYRDFTDLSHVLAALEKQESISALFHSTEEGATRVKQLEFSFLDRENGLISLVKTDITQAQQQQLEQEERLRRALELAETATAAKSDFLSSMSHDLRTPLNGVLGFTAFALRENDPRKKQEYLERIASSGQLLLSLINDTLDLSRIESGKAVPEPEAVMSDDLIPAVVSALRPSAELKGVNLVENLRDYRNEPMWADKLKINKIALNLLSNAIKFTPAGGTVTVTPYCSAALPEKRNCGFIIEDTGIGMSEEFLKHMYEPFSQEKRSESVQLPGTGLGLSIVKRYVDLLGGTIRVESHVHAGTRWEVTLPVTKLENGLQQKPKAESLEALKGRRVLLCEDNQMNTEIASMLLKDKGMLVETAENGAIGLKMFAASPEDYYDIVLMDIRMPEMDGLEAVRRIRALDRPDAVAVPVIAMTADAFEESIREAKAAGMNAYITKPIEPGKMFETLRRWAKK